MEEGRAVGPMEASQSVATLSPVKLQRGGKFNERGGEKCETHVSLRHSEAQQSQAPPSYHGVSTEHPAYTRAESLVARGVRGHRVITVIVTVMIVLLTV